MSQRNLIMLLIGVLLLVVVVSAVVLAVLPNQPTAPTPVGTSSVGGGSGAGFDLSVLDRSQYKELDQQPIQNGLLPVRPPASTGKANPFL